MIRERIKPQSEVIRAIVSGLVYVMGCPHLLRE